LPLTSLLTTRLPACVHGMFTICTRFRTICDQLNPATVVNYTFYFQTIQDLHSVAFQCKLQVIYTPNIFNNKPLLTSVVYGHFSEFSCTDVGTEDRNPSSIIPLLKAIWGLFELQVYNLRTLPFVNLLLIFVVNTRE